jgi:nitrosocyanin
MKFSRLVQSGLLGILVVSLLVVWSPGAAQAATKEFQIVLGEWSWKAKPGEAGVPGLDGKEVRKIERYVFDPGFIVVNKGDDVVLHFHDVKGSKHQIEIKAFGVKEFLIKRGEVKTVKFKANKAGNFEIGCKNHVDATKEGPMIGYIYVVDR